MSWIVESLLLNRHGIRQEFNPYDDTYDDLLTVESKVETLVRDGIIDKSELEILNLVIESGSFSQVGEDLNLSPWTVSKYFHNTCNKISYYLGGVFTDIGYTQYIKDKYDLNDDDTRKMIEYMKSIYKHRIKRTVSTEGEESSES